MRKGKAQRGEAAELDELQIDAQQQRVKSGDDARMKPEPLQSLQLVAQPAEIAQETLKCIFFSRELSQALLPEYFSYPIMGR